MSKNHFLSDAAFKALIAEFGALQDNLASNDKVSILTDWSKLTLMIWVSVKTTKAHSSLLLEYYATGEPCVAELQEKDIEVAGLAMTQALEGLHLRCRKGYVQHSYVTYYVTPNFDYWKAQKG